jgi:hypothetical protein
VLHSKPITSGLLTPLDYSGNHQDDEGDDNVDEGEEQQNDSGDAAAANGGDQLSDQQQLADTDQDMQTATNSDSSKDQQIVFQVISSGKKDSATENMLMKLFAWIKDLPEELQQQILSSFSVQQVLKFLENTLSPHKFIEDQSSFQVTQEKFETEHQPYGNYTGTSQELAKSNVGVPISLDGYTGETLSNGILMDLDPLQKLPVPLGLVHSFGDIGQLSS